MPNHFSNSLDIAAMEITNLRNLSLSKSEKKNIVYYKITSDQVRLLSSSLKELYLPLTINKPTNQPTNKYMNEWMNELIIN